MQLLHLDGAKQAGKFITACVQHPEVVHRETISVHMAFILDVIRGLEDICVYYSIGTQSGLKTVIAEMLTPKRI